MVEIIRCNCLHKSLANCFYCRTKHNLVPQPSCYEHHFCENCDRRIIQITEPKCSVCDTMVNKWNRTTVMDNLFNSVVEMSLEKYNEKLKETLKCIHDGVAAMDVKVTKLRFDTKNAIDKRVDTLKHQLETKKIVLHRQIDSVCEAYLKEIKVLNISETEFSKATFLENQKKLTTLSEKIQQYKADLEKIKFVSSETDIKTDEIGKIEQSLKVANFSEYYHLCNDIPALVNTRPECHFDMIGLDKALTNVDTFSCIKSLLGHTNFVICLSHIESNILASGSYDTTIRIWNLDTFECISTLKGHTSHVNSLCPVKPKVLASCSSDWTIKIWSLDSYSCTNTLHGHIGPVNCLTLIKPNILASGSDDKSIRIWNIEKQYAHCTDTLLGHTGSVQSLCLLKANILASGSNDWTIKIWNLDTSACINTLVGHKSDVRCLSLIKPGVLASGSFDKTVKIWNFEDCTCVATIRHSMSFISCLSLVRPNILAISSGFADESAIKIIDLDNYTCIHNLLGHWGEVRSLSFVKPYMLASSSDPSIKIWKIDSKISIFG